VEIVSGHSLDLTDDSSPPPTNNANDPALPVVNGDEEHEPEIVESSIEPASPETPAILATPEAQKEVEIPPTDEGILIHKETPGAQTESMALPQTQLNAPTELLDSQDTPRSNPSESQSSISRSTYQMPPPFVPANQQQANGMHPELAHAPQPHLYNGQQPMHHGHPSNGGSVIHGYPGSNTSSPAPPLSGGHLPPYPYQQHPAGRHAPHLSNGVHPPQAQNGYANVGPPPPGQFYQRSESFMNTGPGAENFARHQMNVRGPTEPYSSNGTPAGADSRGNVIPPSTPRSLHGSQSSTTNEHENGHAYHGQYPTAVVTNGSNGQIDDVRLYHPNRSKSRGANQSMSSAPPNGYQPPPHIDPLDGLVPYLQAKFNDPFLADFTVELRFSDDRAPPVRILGHGLILARSPTLNSMMHDLATDSTTDGVASRTLLLESGDRFLTSEGFWMAMQRLYGNALLDHGIFSRRDPEILAPPTRAEQVSLALGYAAAGKLLHMPPVTARGIEVAATLLDFSNLDLLLEFALDGGLDAQWMAPGIKDRSIHPPTYGPHVNRLIHACISFLIDKFPARLFLDTSVGETAYTSLPSIPDPRPTSHNPRLSQIKFGDHSTEDSAEVKAVPSTLDISSRVFLNLPFHLLKYVLESSLPITVEAADPLIRKEMMSAIIDERERRRLKVHGSPVSNTERLANFRKWEVVGWKEKIEVLGSHQGFPVLTRMWVDITNPAALD